jgi:methyl-accepting chemotaxis protein
MGKNETARETAGAVRKRTVTAKTATNPAAKPPAKQTKAAPKRAAAKKTTAAAEAPKEDQAARLAAAIVERDSALRIDARISGRVLAAIVPTEPGVRNTLTPNYHDFVTDIDAFVLFAAKGPGIVDLLGGGGMSKSGHMPRSWTLTTTTSPDDFVTTEYTEPQLCAAITTARYIDTAMAGLDAASRWVSYDKITAARETMSGHLVEWAQYGLAKQSLNAAREQLKTAARSPYLSAEERQAVSDARSQTEAEFNKLSEELQRQTTETTNALRIFIGEVESTARLAKAAQENAAKQASQDASEAVKAAKEARRQVRRIVTPPARSASTEQDRQAGSVDPLGRGLLGAR